jgi:hypothetical protein
MKRFQSTQNQVGRQSILCIYFVWIYIGSVCIITHAFSALRVVLSMTAASSNAEAAASSAETHSTQYRDPDGFLTEHSASQLSSSSIDILPCSDRKLLDEALASSSLALESGDAFLHNPIELGAGCSDY